MLLFCQDNEAELVVMKICIFDKYVTTRHATFAHMLVTVYANFLENTRKHQNSAS